MTEFSGYTTEGGKKLDWEELKPCPFCGGEASKSIGNYENGRDYPYIECLDCGASTEPDKWNRRQPSPTSAVDWKELEKIIREFTLPQYFTKFENYAVYLETRKSEWLKERNDGS